MEARGVCVIDSGVGFEVDDVSSEVSEVMGRVVVVRSEDEVENNGKAAVLFETSEEGDGADDENDTEPDVDEAGVTGIEPVVEVDSRRTELLDVRLAELEVELEERVLDLQDNNKDPEKRSGLDQSLHCLRDIDD